MRLYEPYDVAAAKYRPTETTVLFVAEAPPDSLDRYFYFENVKRDDWLWIALMKALYTQEWGETKTERQRKKWWLLKFKKDQFRLIDAIKFPIAGSHGIRVQGIRSGARELIEEIKQIVPRQIVLIKATVHEVLFTKLKDAGLPVVNRQALPFPGSGWQTEFHDQLRQLVDTGDLQLA
jgi:hypothetical protein